MAFSERDLEILKLNQETLTNVAAGDWQAYSAVCADDVSCFEAESEGHLVEGLPFHRYYFDLPGDSSQPAPAVNVTMARPHLRWLSDDSVVVSYTRLTQKLVNGAPVTARCCETRIWQKLGGSWKQVHVHRS